MPRPAYGKPATPAEWRALDEASTAVFHMPKGRFRRWTRALGRGNARVVRRDGRVAGGLVLLPMGQWFGGRRVSMAGIAAVTVLPEDRALGAASGMMRECAREIAASGTALSGLYPATQPVYRQAGWETAGVRIHYSAKCASMETRERGLEVRRGGRRDLPAIRRLYGELARAGAGLLDRTPYMWERRLGALEDDYETYIFHRGRAAEAYCILARRRHEGPIHEIQLFDFAFSGPAAGRRLLAFLAANRSFVQRVEWCGGPADGLLYLLREQDFEIKGTWHWMIRIADLRRALEERGYPEGLSAEVHLAIEDDLVGRNAGRWVLRVAGGRGRVARGGRGTVGSTVSALAPVYTGFRSPREQRALGGMDGPDRDLAALGAMFAGPTPWNREMY